MGFNKIENSKLEKLKNLNFSKITVNKEIEINHNVDDLYESNEDFSNQFLINRKRNNNEALDLEEEIKGKK